MKVSPSSRDFRPWMQGREFHCLTDPKEYHDLIDELVARPRFGFDTETDGLHPTQARICGLCLSPEPKRGYYVPIRHQKGTNLDLDCALEGLGRLTQAETPAVDMYNALFDMQMTANDGRYWHWRKVRCAMLAYWLIDSSRKLRGGLKAAALGMFGYEMVELWQLFMDKKPNKKQFVPTVHALDPLQVTVYGASDAMVTTEMGIALSRDRYLQMQEKIFLLEMGFTECLRRMERQPVLLDIDYVRRWDERLTSDIKGIEARIYRLVGRPFNIASTDQLAKLLYDELGLPCSKYTGKSQARSVDEEALTPLERLHPVVPLILQYKELTKLHGTYLTPFLVSHDPATHETRIGHVQNSTETGRVSGRKGGGFEKDGKLMMSHTTAPKNRSGRADCYDVRQVVIAHEGYKLASVDFANEEMRLAANMSGERNWIEQLNAGANMHRAMAALIYKKEMAAVNDVEYAAAKGANFKYLYGGGSPKEDLYNSYYAAVPQLKAWQDQQKAQMRKFGFVRSAWGRVRRAEDLVRSGEWSKIAYAERQAVNSPVQACLDANTRIATSAGWVRIVDLLERDCRGLKVWDGFEYHDFRPVRQPVQDVIDVEFEDGLKMRCTASHLFCCMTVAGYQWVRAGDLTKDSAVMVPIRAVEGGVPAVVKAERVYPGSNAARNNAVAFEMTSGMAEVLGHYVGDGWYAHPAETSIAFNEQERDAAEWVMGQINAVAPRFARIHATPRRTGSVVLNVNTYRRSWVDALRQLGMQAVKAHEKAVPESIWRSPLDHRRAFLRGLFNADGTVTNDGAVILVTVSETLARDTQKLLRSVGILAAIRQYPTCWRVYLDTEFAGRFAVEIGFRSGRKRTMLTERIRENRSSRRMLNAELSEWVSNHPRPAAEISRSSQTLLCAVRGKRQRVSQRKALELVGESHSMREVLQNFRLTGVKSITSAGRTETFDLQVDSPFHGFVADGAVVHNSGADVLRISLTKLILMRLEEKPYLAELIRPLLLVHDEICYEIAEDETIRNRYPEAWADGWTFDKLLYLVCETMESVSIPGWQVPLLVDGHVNRCWSSVGSQGFELDRENKRIIWGKVKKGKVDEFERPHAKLTVSAKGSKQITVYQPTRTRDDQRWLGNLLRQSVIEDPEQGLPLVVRFGGEGHDHPLPNLYDFALLSSLLDEKNV